MSALPAEQPRQGDPIRLGIEDPRRFVQHVIDDELRSRGASLDEEKRDDLASFLLVRLCELADRYDPNRGSLSFTTLAYRILRRRYTDWLRERRGDSRYGNDGREESVADVDVYGGCSVDELDFDALVEEIDHERLSNRARGALREISVRHAKGMSVGEAAAALGMSRREASGDLKRLREELKG